MCATMATYESTTLDRMKKKIFQKRGVITDQRKLRERASSIDSLYTGKKVKDIPEFSLIVRACHNTGERGRELGSEGGREGGSEGGRE